MENAKNPMAIGCMKINGLWCMYRWFIYCTKKDRAPIMVDAGKTQMSKVRVASKGPPRL